MKKFFASLSHSAKVTLVTCGCFLLLTMLILTFFMLVPVKVSNNANHVNDDLIVTTAVTQVMAETTAEATGTTFHRQTTDKNRKSVTTSTVARGNGWQSDGYDTYGNDTDNGYDNGYDVIPEEPVYTSPGYDYSTPDSPSYTQPAPVYTDPPAPVYTNPPAPVETIPAPDSDNMYD